MYLTHPPGQVMCVLFSSFFPLQTLFFCEQRGKGLEMGWNSILNKKGMKWTSVDEW
jgi:hypothetical protein